MTNVVQFPTARPTVGAIYSEMSYFDGFHFAHIAAYEEDLRLQHKRKSAVAAFRRNHPRLVAFWSN